MCNCASCEYTDSFRTKGFNEWPKGQPKGPRKAKAEYAAHVSFGRSGTGTAIPFKPGADPVFPAWTRGFVPPAPLPQKYMEILARGPQIYAESV